MAAAQQPPKRPRDEDDAGVGYQWEKEYERTWDAIDVDESGRLLAAEAREHTSRVSRARVTALVPVRKGLLRHVVLGVDCSGGTCLETDFPPSRLAAILEASRECVTSFFSKNPVASMGVVAASHSNARTIARLSHGVRAVSKALATIDAADQDAATVGHASSSASLAFGVGGDFSVSSVVDECLSVLEAVPPFGTKDIVLLYGAISTRDTTDVEALLARAKRLNVRIHVIGLSGEVHAFHHVASATGGSFHVALSASHLSELLRDALDSERDEGVAQDQHLPMERVGFPQQAIRQDGLLLPEHVVSQSGFDCPQCLSRCGDLPSKCRVCGLRLLSASHLARSFHHVVPVQPFVAIPSAKESTSIRVTELSVEWRSMVTALRVAPTPGVAELLPAVASTVGATRVSDVEDQLATVGMQRQGQESTFILTYESRADRCQGCTALLEATSPRYACRGCLWTFCGECDVDIHELLHVCPGCPQR
jgi:transcription initiation factor TFIIH subunit 2